MPVVNEVPERLSYAVGKVYDCINQFSPQDSNRLPFEKLAEDLEWLQREKSLLSFAWEKMSDDFESKVTESVAGASVLVVIGYSFPYFNRSVDKLLFQKMVALDKIYIQVIDSKRVELNVRNLFTPVQIKSIETEIELIDQVDKFYLPPEL